MKALLLVLALHGALGGQPPAPLRRQDRERTERRERVVQCTRPTLFVPTDEIYSGNWVLAQSISQATVTYNAGLAPDGKTTATQLQQNQNVTATNAFSIFRYNLNLDPSSKATYIYSTFVKAVAGSPTPTDIWLYVNDDLGGYQPTVAQCLISTGHWTRCSTKPMFKSALTSINPSIGYFQGFAAETVSGSKVLLWGAMFQNGTHLCRYRKPH